MEFDPEIRRTFLFHWSIISTQSLSNIIIYIERWYIWRCSIQLINYFAWKYRSRIFPCGTLLPNVSNIKLTDFKKVSEMLLARKRFESRKIYWANNLLFRMVFFPLSLLSSSLYWLTISKWVRMDNLAKKTFVYVRNATSFSDSLSYLWSVASSDAWSCFWIYHQEDKFYDRNTHRLLNSWSTDFRTQKLNINFIKS